MPKVTIIIPNLDAHSNLDQCIYSLVNQTEPDIEILGFYVELTTEKLLQKYNGTDTRLSFIKNDTPCSGSFLKNTGIKIAKSDHILFVNAGDYLNHDLIETVLPWAQLTDNDLVLFGHVMHYPGAKEVEHIPLLRVGDDKESIFRCFLLEHKGIGTNPWEFLYKKEFLLKKNILFEEELQEFGNILFIAKALHHANGISSIPKTLYHYNKDNRYTSDFRSRTQDRFKTIDQLEHFMLKAGTLDKFKDEFTVFKLRFGYILAAHEYFTTHSNNKELRKYIKQILKSPLLQHINLHQLKLQSDEFRNKNTLSYQELHRLKNTLCRKFTLLEISYRLTVKLLKYKKHSLWKKLPEFMRNPML